MCNQSKYCSTPRFQGYFGAMGCLLELLKNESCDYSVFKPLYLPAQTNGTLHSDTQTNFDAKIPNTVKSEILLNGDSDAATGALHLQKKTADHSKHGGAGDYIHRNPSQTHSKKPDSLDLNTVKRDST